MISEENTEQTLPTLSKAQNSTIKDITSLANLLDSRFTIPGMNMKFGIDGLIGLIPGIGDILTALLGLYVILRAILLGGSFFLIVRMLFNLLIDAILGTIPLAGDMFDLAFRSNSMNLKMLIRHLEKKSE